MTKIRKNINSIPIKKADFFTIPNLMGYFRILLLPFIGWAIWKEHYWTKIILLSVSALTDFLDGKIARKFNQVTELGKMLDPVADKLTLCILFLCLAGKEPYAGVIAVIMVVKEIYMGGMELWLLHKIGKTTGGALWYGKLCTAALFLGLGIYLLFPGLPERISFLLMIGICLMMLFAAFMYGIQFYREVQEAQKISK
ncbi:MAG: CDP-alcohol phosphatidyltransferase family protein [Lachnospiraceae bacterium]|nr:CDP-alcohol phosphatidyltransferase family protein [Lachnospiraceae bacterium]